MSDPVAQPAQDISELMAILTFGFALKKAGTDILVGGFKPQNLGELLPVYTAALPVFQNLSQALPELESLDAASAQQLADYVVSQGAVSASAGQIVADSLKIAVDAYALFELIKK